MKQPEPGFPTDFTDKAEVLKSGISQPADEALSQLSQRDLVVTLGFEREMLPAIQAMARQKHIGNYCGRDCSEDRFATEESTSHWLSRGRAFFTLSRRLPDGNLRPVGYGWGGPGKSSEIPAGQTTWAVRLGEEAVGQKLSEPFSRIIVDATTNLYGAGNIWLETWESNAAGVHTYGKLGFKLVAKKPDKRITADGQAVDDVRLYMDLPAT